MVCKSLLRWANVRLGLIVGVLLVGALVSMQSTGYAKAVHAQSNVKSIPSELQAEVVCTVEHAGINQTFPGIRCAADGQTYWYTLPLSTNDPVQINRVLAIGLTAQAMNRKVWIAYDSTQTDLPPTCGENQCRKIIWLYTSTS